MPILPTNWNDPVPGSIVLSAMEDDGAPVLVAELPYEADSGWDSMDLRYVCRRPSLADAEAAFIARGSKLDDRNLWVTARRVARLHADFYGCDATALGMLTDRGYKAQFAAAGNMSAVENFQFTEAGVTRVYPKAQVVDSDPTVQLQYVVVGAKPDTTTVGTAVEPPEAYRPGTKESIWATLASPTLHYPFGWVLMARDVDALSGITGVWLATDRYAYQQKLTP